MANPFGYVPTYIPQYQQSPQGPQGAAPANPLMAKSSMYGATQGDQLSGAPPPGQSGFHGPSQIAPFGGLRTDFSGYQMGTPMDVQKFNVWSSSFQPGHEAISREMRTFTVPMMMGQIPGPNFNPGDQTFSQGVESLRGYMNDLNYFHQNILPQYKDQIDAFRGSAPLPQSVLDALDYNRARANVMSAYNDLYSRYRATGTFGQI